MTQKIEIEGQIARLVEVRVLAETPLSEMMPHLETKAPTYLPLLPDNTRVIAFNPENGRGGILIELAPARKHLRIHNDRGTTAGVDATRQNAQPDHIGVFHLQLPWQYFFYSFTMGQQGEAYNEGVMQDFRLDQGLYFWRPERIKELTDPLWVGKVPNVDTSGWICWGYTRHETESLSARLNDMIRNFANTTFNYHLDAHKPDAYRSYTGWEKDSLDNPLCYQAWEEWKTVPRTTVQSVFENNVENLPKPSDLTRSYDETPEPPQRFTFARALDWMNSLPPQDRNRMLHALRDWTEANPYTPDTDEVDDDEATPDTGTADAAPDRPRATAPTPAGT